MKFTNSGISFCCIIYCILPGRTPLSLMDTPCYIAESAVISPFGSGEIIKRTGKQEEYSHKRY